MTDVTQFIHNCKQRHPDEFRHFDKEYETFRLGVLLKQARSEAGLTQEEVARQPRCRKL